MGWLRSATTSSARSTSPRSIKSRISAKFETSVRCNGHSSRSNPTRVQQATVIALVEARRLDVVPADAARATSFLRQAEERLRQLPLLTSAVVRYGIAYDACHDTGEALLAAYGFRTTNGPGQHEALGRYLRAILDKPPADKAAREFDRLRRARNQDRYEAKPVGAAATEKAEQVARTLFDAAVTRGIPA